MSSVRESAISKAILDSYHRKLSSQIETDVVVVGAGPSGLTAALYLVAAGRRVTVLEKRLAAGGGIWGGGMGMNEVAIEDEAVPVLDKAGVRHDRHCDGFYIVDAMELASALCLAAIQTGAGLLNLVTLEDLCVHSGRVTGVVVNRTGIAGALPVDPIVLMAPVVIDATGHDAVAVEHLRRRGLLKPESYVSFGEGALDATAGEAFVVERVAEVYPGLWVTGMSVATTFSGPRMGPIFGGMLLSGKRVAELVEQAWA